MNCRPINKTSRGCNGWVPAFLLALAVSLFLPPTGFCATHIIDAIGDLPYTTSGTYDTVSLQANGLISTSTSAAITLDDKHCVLNLNGNTLYVCQTSGTISGINISADSCTVLNGTLEQHSTAVATGCRIINVGTGRRHTTLINVSAHARNQDSRGMFSYTNPELEINGGNWTSYVTALSDRQYAYSSCISSDETTWDTTGQFRTWIHHVTIDSCPHMGITLRGGVNWVDSCNVTCDGQNTLYPEYPSGSMFHGWANNYAILFGRYEGGSRILGNTVRSGVNHGGGRGISLGATADNTYSTSFGGWMTVAYNDVDVHGGPSPDYGNIYVAHAFHIKGLGCDSLWVHHNTFRVSADTLESTRDIGPKVGALWLMEGGKYWLIEHNRLIANGVAGSYGYIPNNGVCDTLADSACGSTAAAVVFDALGSTNPDLVQDSIVFRDNYIESNILPIQFGARATGGSLTAGEEIRFYNDTIKRNTPSYQDEWQNSGGIVMGLSNGEAINNYITDPVFEGDTTVDWDGTGQKELTLRKTIRLTLLGSNGEPVSGARVRIKNNYSLSVLLDNSTDSLGQADAALANIRYYHANIGSDSTFNPFVMSAIYGSDSVGESKSFGWATNGYDTLILAHTLGGLTLTAPALIGNGVGTLNNMKIPRNKATFSGHRFYVSPDQASSSSTAWWYSADTGQTYVAVTPGYWMGSGNAQGHNLSFYEENVGMHWFAPGNGDIDYRFITDPATSTSNIGTHRQPSVPLSGSNRVSGVAYGGRVWAVVRSSYGDSLGVIWSDNDFSSTTGSQQIYIGYDGCSKRIHMSIDENGAPAIFLFSYPSGGCSSAPGIRYWSWNGTTLVYPSNGLIYNGALNYNERAMCVTRTTGKWHVLHAIGTNLVHWVSTAGTSWTQTTLSTGSVSAGLNYFPSMTDRSDTVFAFYGVGSGTDHYLKIWDPVTGWDVDSLGPVNGTVTEAANNFQSPEHLSSNFKKIPFYFVDAAGALWGGLVNLSGGTAPEVEIVSTPTTPSGTDSAGVNQSLSFTTGGSTSSLGHSIEYRFDWDDGSFSAWLASSSGSHDWDSPGIYTVRAEARCATDNGVISSWSTGLDVTITGPPPVTGTHLIKGMLRP